jgi:hypothetical protein
MLDDSTGRDVAEFFCMFSASFVLAEPTMVGPKRFAHIDVCLLNYGYVGSNEDFPKNLFNFPNPTPPISISAVSISLVPNANIVFDG